MYSVATDVNALFISDFSFVVFSLGLGTWVLSHILPPVINGNTNVFKHEKRQFTNNDRCVLGLSLLLEKIVEGDFGLDYAAVAVSAQPICRNKSEVAVVASARLALERPHLLTEARRIVRVYRELLRRELHLAEIDDTVPSLYDKVYLRPSDVRIVRNTPP